MVLVVVEDELGGSVTAVVVVGASAGVWIVDGGAVDVVVVVVGATPVSGDTHPAGGEVAPD